MDKKNILIAGLAVAIILGATAFAALGQTFNISGRSNATGTWKLDITNITEEEVVMATTSVMEYTATTATFEVDLDEPTSKATYDITITNGGTIDARLDSILGLVEANEALPTEIEYTLTGINVNDVLPAGGTHTATLTAEWATQEIPTTKFKTATLTFNYIQDLN